MNTFPSPPDVLSTRERSPWSRFRWLVVAGWSSGCFAAYVVHVEVPHAVFIRWQVLGGLVWTIGVCAAGYALGKTIPSIDRYLLPVIAVVVLVSLTPIALEALRNRRGRV